MSSFSKAHRRRRRRREAAGACHRPPSAAAQPAPPPSPPGPEGHGPHRTAALLLLHHLEHHGVDGVVLVLRVHLPELLAALLPQHLALRRAVGRRHRAALLPQQLAALGQHRQLRVRLLLRLLVLARALVQWRRRLLVRRLPARVRGGHAHGES